MPDPAALAVAQIFRIDYHSFLRDHNLPAILFDLLDLYTVESAGRSLNLAIAARNAGQAAAFGIDPHRLSAFDLGLEPVPGWSTSHAFR